MLTKGPHDQCLVNVVLPDVSVKQHLVFGGHQCGQPVGKRIEVLPQ